MFKSDFPLIVNHPEILYLDNAATTQKPAMVIDGVSEFLKNEYANIHRWHYDLSEKSEIRYEHSKELVAELLNCSNKEVIYTANATASFNLLAQTLVNSNIINKWDTVLMWVRDHHANILPWMSLSKLFWFKVEFFWLDENYDIDFDDFKEKYTNDVKIVSCWWISNVTWWICDVKKLKTLLRDDTFYIVDASQAAPNMLIDFQEVGCEAMVFTAHKMMAHTGVGGLILKRDYVKELKPLALWWWTINDVSVDDYVLRKWRWKYEAGTPNIIWAVSLEYALEYIKSLWEGDIRKGMSIIEKHEQELAEYWIEKFKELKDKVRLIGPEKNRIPLFSFIIHGHENINQVGEYFADKWICIRCGWHCAYPLHKNFQIGGTCRMSTYIYNEKEDLDRFFDVLNELINS